MKSLSFFLICFFFVTTLCGQSIDDLRSQKKRAMEQANRVAGLLEQTQEREKQTIDQLGLISSEINYRKAIVSSIADEINIIDDAIANNELVSKMLQNDIAQLKEEYADMIRFAQRSMTDYDVILHLLSADDGTQAYQRWLYIRQYAKYRKIQYEAILAVNEDIEASKQSLQKQRALKDDLLMNRSQELTKLDARESQEARMLTNLYNQKIDLQNEVVKHQQLQRQLDEQIEQVLSAEMESNRDTTVANSPTAINSFEANKGKLSWPVDEGVITEHFGVHQHPTIKTVTVRSNGIDISCAPQSMVKSVFEGTVSRVFALAGANSYAVIVRHGSYLTVYSNLSDVKVKAGQSLQVGNVIGSLAVRNNTSVLKFQIWKENNKLDPEEWLK